jgi:hypothetical protein
MSHTVEVKTEIKDVDALKKACEHLDLDVPLFGNHKLYQSKKHEGWSIKLPGWNYPIVCNTETGELHFDNYEGRWGDLERLRDLKQRYTVEKTVMVAERQGRRVSEEQLENGNVKLSIQID